VISRYVDLDGPVHYLDFGGSGRPLVCVHGLAGSALNWMAVGPRLAEGHRVLAPDLRGFGMTPLDGGTARVNDNQRLLDRFLREVAGEPAVLVGNSMGGLIAVLQASRAPESVRSLVLVDPALPGGGRRPFDLKVWSFFAAMLAPGASRLTRNGTKRWSAERIVAAVLAIVCADPGRVPDEVVRAHVNLTASRLAAYPKGDRPLVQASRSLLGMLYRGRSFQRVYTSVRCPVLIIHGARDRLVPPAVSLSLGRRHGWDVEVLPGLGHVPMMEAPDRFLNVTGRWLAPASPVEVR
jgi:pimeloyl-ACP methyl ester carboxylesterase